MQSNIPTCARVGIQQGISNAITPFRGTYVSVCLLLTAEDDYARILCS